MRPATADSRRAALFHLLVNALGAIVLLVGFRSWVAALDALVPGDPQRSAADGAAARGWPSHIALAHTSFNLMHGRASRMPLLHAAGGRRRAPGRARTRASAPGSPSCARAWWSRRRSPSSSAGSRSCTWRQIAGEALQRTRQLYDDLTSPGTELRAAILALEKRTDTMQHEITVFMSRVMAGVLTVAQSAESRGLLRVADEIESVADYCERLANYRRRLLREHIVFGDDALHDLQSYLDRTIAFYEEIVDRARRNETGWRLAIVTKGQYLATEADGLREANLQRLANQRIEPGAGLFFNDMLLAMRRIRNHALNMAEAWLGERHADGRRPAAREPRLATGTRTCCRWRPAPPTLPSSR